jgi:hypothetical protein
VAWSYVNASDRTSLYADIAVSLPGKNLPQVIVLSPFFSSGYNTFWLNPDPDADLDPDQS